MFSGSCHCGNVTFRVTANTISPLIECNCSYCLCKGYLLWFVPRESVHLSVAGAALTSYRFNKHVIDHQFCPVCGCAPLAFGQQADGSATAAINVRCMEGVDIGSLRRIAYDGKAL